MVLIGDTLQGPNFATKTSCDIYAVGEHRAFVCSVQDLGVKGFVFREVGYSPRA